MISNCEFGTYLWLLSDFFLLVTPNLFCDFRVKKSAFQHHYSFE
jgi:hypothetical protein